jgi:hypothetical protein
MGAAAPWRHLDLRAFGSKGIEQQVNDSSAPSRRWAWATDEGFKMSDAKNSSVQLDGVNSRPSSAAQWMVLTRCAWRINWLGIAFDQKREFVWMMLSWLAAVLIFMLGWVSSFADGYVLDSRWWVGANSSGGAGVFWALCATGVAARLARFAQALWVPISKELGSLGAQYPKLAVFLSPLWFGAHGNAKWALKALEWAREEGFKKRIAPVQALWAVAVVGMLIILSFEFLLLTLSWVLSLTMGALLLFELSRGDALTLWSLQPWRCGSVLLILAIWARQAVGMGAWSKVKAALGQFRSSCAKATPVSLASKWTQSKSRWTEALLRQAERDGALSEAESALLEKETPPAHCEQKGAKLRL